MLLKLFLMIKLTHQILLKEKNSADLSTLWFECGEMTSNIISLVALSFYILIILPCIISQNVSFKNDLFWQVIEEQR